MKRAEDLGENGLKIFQDDSLYTFTSDSILLSRFARVKPKEVCADFCAGVGIVGFHTYGLSPEKFSSVTFFEMQKPLYDLLSENIRENGLQDKFTAVNCRLQDITAEHAGRYSLILCNPPYMKIGGGEKDADMRIALCRTEIALSLKELVSAFKKCLKFGGRVCMVHRVDRLADIIYEFKCAGIEPKRLKCVRPKKDANPYLVLIEGVRGGKSGLTVLADAVN